MRRPPSFFKYVIGKYVIGSFVKLSQGVPMQRVIWRGKQVVTDIVGRPHEALVYRIDDGHWDCYYEYQLHAALTREEDTPVRRRRRGL